MKVQCVGWRLLAMPMFVVACGFAAGCTQNVCPAVEVQPGGNEADVDPELLKDCEEEEDEGAAEEGAPKVKGPGMETEGYENSARCIHGSGSTTMCAECIKGV